MKTVEEYIHEKFKNVKISIQEGQELFHYTITLVSFTPESRFPEEEKKHVLKQSIQKLKEQGENLIVWGYDGTEGGTVQIVQEVHGERAKKYLDKKVEELQKYETLLVSKEVSHEKMYGQGDYSKYEHRFADNLYHEVFHNPDLFYRYKEVVHDLPEAVFKYDISEAFIEYYQYDISWDRVVVFQNLSEAFIEKHLDKMPINYVASYQDLSNAFIRKHQSILPFHSLSGQSNLSMDLLEEFEDKWDWTRVFLQNIKNMSPEFIEKNKHKIDWDDVYHSTYGEYGEEYVEEKYADFLFVFREELEKQRKKEEF